MSVDVMLQGVLRLPIDCWSNDPTSYMPRYSRYVQAADKIESLESDNAALKDRVTELEANIESEDISHGVTVDQREHWESKATELAEDIGKALGFEVGEHTSENCPVQNAIDEIYRCGNKYL